MKTARKVLVAGGTGTIGVPLVQRLLARGADVTVVAADPPSRAGALFGRDVNYLRLDLTDPANCLAATHGMADVYNLVGIKGSVGIGESKVAAYFHAMSLFQTHLMDAAFRNGAERFLFVSSICAYPRSDRPKQEDTCWDGMPQQNDRIPGVMKRMGEVQAEAYRLQYGWEAPRIIRPSNVYGPFDDFDPATAQVIPALIRRLTDGESPLSVWGDGSAIRDFIFSEDVAHWAIEAMDRAPPCTPINLGSGSGVSIREVVETLLSLLPSPPEVRWNPQGPGGDPVRILDLERAHAMLDYRVLTPLRDGLARTMDWLRATPADSIIRERPRHD